MVKFKAYIQTVEMANKGNNEMAEVITKSLTDMAVKLNCFNEKESIYQLQVVAESNEDVFFLDVDNNCNTEERIYENLCHAIAEKMVRDSSFRKHDIKF